MSLLGSSDREDLKAYYQNLYADIHPASTITEAVDENLSSEEAIQRRLQSLHELYALALWCERDVAPSLRVLAERKGWDQRRSRTNAAA